MKKILFVCTGNSCRSPMAEGLLEKMLRDKGVWNIEVFSAGTHPLPGASPTQEAINILRRKERVDISRHRGAEMTHDLISQSDLILAMGENHKEKILEMNPEARDKVFLLKEFAGDGADEESLDIPDPIGQPMNAYERCLLEIKDALESVLPKIIEMLTK